LEGLLLGGAAALALVLRSNWRETTEEPQNALNAQRGRQNMVAAAAGAKVLVAEFSGAQVRCFLLADGQLSQQFRPGPGRAFGVNGAPFESVTPDRGRI
jgi:hypothetical protein